MTPRGSIWVFGRRIIGCSVRHVVEDRRGVGVSVQVVTPTYPSLWCYLFV
jgi:hypothetical protein